MQTILLSILGYLAGDLVAALLAWLGIRGFKPTANGVPSQTSAILEHPEKLGE